MAKQRLSVDADLSVIKEQLREVESVSQGIRLLAIYQYKLGRDSEELAKFYNVSYRSICNWINAYNTSGLDGLRDKQRSGRPSRLDEKQKEKLRTAITDTPRNYGYKTDAWTVALVNDYIKREFDVEYKRPQVYNLLHDMDMSFRRGQKNNADATDAENGDKKRMKRTPKTGLGKEQMKKLKSAIKNGPRKCGYMAEIWTVPLIAAYIKREFGQAYDNAKIYNILNDIGIYLRQHDAQEQEQELLPTNPPESKQTNKRKNAKTGLNEEQQKKLKSALADKPRNHGFTAKTWTVPKVAEYIEREFGISYNRVKVYRILYAMGIYLSKQKDVASNDPKANDKKSSATSNFDEEQMAKLRFVLKYKPQDYGYTEKAWSVPLLIGHIEREFGISYDKSRVYRLLYRMGVQLRNRDGGINLSELKEKNAKTISKTELDETQTAKLKQTLADTPRNYGYQADVWNVPLIRNYIEREFGATYDKSRIYRLLYSMDIYLRYHKRNARTALRSETKIVEKKTGNRKKTAKTELDEKLAEELKPILADTPRNYGYDTDNWKVPMISEIIKHKFDEEYDGGKVYRLLYRMKIYLKDLKADKRENASEPKNVKKKLDEKQPAKLNNRKNNRTNATDPKKKRRTKKTSETELNETQTAKLQSALTDTPRNYGYEADNWKIPLIIDYVRREFGVSYESGKIYRLLYGMGVYLKNLKGGDKSRKNTDKDVTKSENKDDNRSKDTKRKKKKTKKTRAPGLNEEQTAKLKSALADNPRNHGFDAENWTASSVTDYIEREFGISYDNTYVYRLLYGIGVRLRRK